MSISSTTGPRVGAWVAIPLGILLLAGCGQDASPLLRPEEGPRRPPSTRAASPDADVRPTVRIRSGSTYETVLVMRENGGGESKQQDCNTNQLFGSLGFRLPSQGLHLEYHRRFDPLHGNPAPAALQRAMDAWSAAAARPGLLRLGEEPKGELGPGRDGRNVIGWRRFIGQGHSAVSAVWLWDDGERLLEADIFFNLRFKWHVNAPIQPGEWRFGAGSGYDLQAAASHEIGHVLGLTDVCGDGDDSNGDEEDATMYGGIVKGELRKQTLTPGDIAGARALAP